MLFYEYNVNVMPLPYRTFAPVWDVFKVSTEKLAGCHMDLARRLQDLIKEVQKYAEEQTKAHKKVLLLFVMRYASVFLDSSATIIEFMYKD